VTASSPATHHCDADSTNDAARSAAGSGGGAEAGKHVASPEGSPSRVKGKASAAADSHTSQATSASACDRSTPPSTSDQYGIIAFDGELVACAPRSVAELPSIHRSRKMPMEYADMHVCVAQGALTYFAA
jgi:hypothetical protein